MLMSATAAPELTVFSATVTLPRPMASISKPRIDELSHWRSVGQGWRRHFRKAMSAPPATMKRVPIRK